MRVWVLVGLCLAFAVRASAQTDSGEDDLGGPQEEEVGQIKRTEGLPQNKTTAERISSPNPTTKGVPWSFPVFWNQTVSVRSFNQDSQLTASPNYTWWFTMAPRWIFSPEHSIGINATVSIEWTDSVQSEFDRPGFTSREALWEDLRLDYLYSVPIRPGGFMFFVAADIRLPTSKFSRSRERYISPGIRFTTARPFAVLQGMQLGFTGAYWGWFSGSNVVLAPEDIQPCRIAPGPGGIQTIDTCGGATASIKSNIRLTGFWTFVPIDRLAFALAFTGVWSQINDLAVGCIPTLTGEVCLDDGTSGRWRTFTNFRATVGYDIKRWLTIGLSYDVWAFYPDSDGSLENPLFNENSRLIITLTFRADGLYASVRDKKAEQARLSAGIEQL